jgi:CheY-like chemotaxis protein
MTEARPDRPLVDAASLEQLRAGLRAMRGGDFGVRLPGSADPLLDDIAAAFNELAARLAEPDPARSRFLPTLSHVLRTPLNSVLVLARLLAQNPAGNLTPRQVEYASVIHSAGSDLLQVISDLIEPDARPVVPAPRVAAENGECRLLVVEAARAGLLTLLTGGAVADGPRPVSVRTATTAEEVAAALAAGPPACVLLDLRAGDALAAAALARVRSDPRSRRVPVLAHGRGEEEKARFARLRDDAADADPIELLELPADVRERIAAHAAATAPAPADGRPGHARLRGKKILVVDDDRRNVFAISSTLEYYEMDVISAGDGRAGIERLRAAPETDLVLMDLMMPGMDGYAAITAIRGMPEFADLPIIAVTAHTMAGDAASAVPGANCCLTKPLDTDELLNRMERCLAG